MNAKSTALAASAAATLMLLASSTVSLAQERGEYEFSVGCVQCHGAGGQGDGPIAQYLVDEVPPITTLSAKNDGVFPVDYVIAVLEGTADIGVHGRDMPLWGPRYRAGLMEQYAGEITEAEAATLARVRTLSLVEYLASIQVQ
jgi:mono/diheme cytochrome c family protein